MPKFNRQTIKRTVAMVTKVKSLVGKKNPGSYRLIQKKKTGLTLYTIHTIIHQDLNKEAREKKYKFIS